jgi:hypothetical protein
MTGEGGVAAGARVMDEIAVSLRGLCGGCAAGAA